MKAALTGCDEMPFVAPTCDPNGPYYFNDELDGTCPVGTTGGPFTVPAGMFVSLSSKEDANQKAQTYLNQTVIKSCVASAGTYMGVFTQVQTPVSGIIPVLTYAIDGGSTQTAQFGLFFSFNNSIEFVTTTPTGNYSNPSYDSGIVQAYFSFELAISVNATTQAMSTSSIAGRATANFDTDACAFPIEPGAFQLQTPITADQSFDASGILVGPQTGTPDADGNPGASWAHQIVISPILAPVVGATLSVTVPLVLHTKLILA